jgi:hypothetical protein
MYKNLIYENYKSEVYSQLKIVYKKLALEHHPDVSQHPNANRRFVELSNAYKVSICLFFFSLALFLFLLFFVAGFSDVSEHPYVNRRSTHQFPLRSY